MNKKNYIVIATVFSVFLVLFPQTTEAVDTTPPSLQASIPANNANQFPRNSSITLDFSEDTTWGNGNIYIKKYNDDSLVEIFNSFTGNNTLSQNHLILNPSAYLPAGETLYIQIDAGALQDTSNNFFLGITNKNDLNFQIEPLDTQKPQLLGVTPPFNGQGVLLNNDLIINFHENVFAKNGLIKIKKSQGDFTAHQFPANSQIVTGSGTNIIRINLPLDLVYDTQYYVNIEGTAFEDASQNTFIGISDKQTWTFTTLHDAVAPQLLELSPDDGDHNVAIQSKFTLHFDENVFSNQGFISLINRSEDEALIEKIDIHSGLVSGSGSQNINFHFSQPLLLNTKYAILVDSGSLSDAAGNSYIGISSNKDWAFTTIRTIYDSTAVSIFNPQVLGVSDNQIFESNPYFRDIAKHWGENYVQELAEKNILTYQTYFRPDDEALRSELVKMAVSAFKIPTAPAAILPFNDVQTSDWYFPYVQSAYQSNIINGFDDVTFRPDSVLTRAEALKIILNASGIKMDSHDHPFLDIKNTWLDSYVGYAFYNNIISGTSLNTFSADSPISRIELVKIIFNVLRLKETLAAK